ncbi:hypothetical protein XELAEV_18010596mg [Xenopus laevis]|uniref:Paraneoplastic antigen Ma-like C-terminal domain-containing protein n=1 Tax=Xenopus laevis TaxID=8355 RepID=A0A974DUH3_XENLA|nr:hypothetical protein XELAEV_18010596mg [Xenopus laevis]
MLLDSDASEQETQRRTCPSTQLHFAQLVEVLAQVGENLRQLTYNVNYKRLKIFSGVEPTPPGEETFEVWRDSAMTAVADWPGSGPALCRKIQESLQRPALDPIKLHREVYPQDGPEKLIELLEDTYGPVEDEIEMLHKFVLHAEESLSGCLKRLQQMLKLLVCRRIIATDRVDSMRLQQLWLAPHVDKGVLKGLQLHKK